MKTICLFTIMIYGWIMAIHSQFSICVLQPLVDNCSGWVKWAVLTIYPWLRTVRWSSTGFSHVVTSPHWGCISPKFWWILLNLELYTLLYVILIHNTHKYYPIFNSCFSTPGVIFLNQTTLANEEHHRIPWCCACTRFSTISRCSGFLYYLVNILLNGNYWIQCGSINNIHVDYNCFLFNGMLIKLYTGLWAPEDGIKAGACAVSRHYMIFCIC